MSGKYPKYPGTEAPKGLPPATNNKFGCERTSIYFHTFFETNFGIIDIFEKYTKNRKNRKNRKNSVFTKSSMKIDFRGIVLKNTVFSVFSVFSVFLCGSTTKKNNQETLGFGGLFY